MNCFYLMWERKRWLTSLNSFSKRSTSRKHSFCIPSPRIASGVGLAGTAAGTRAAAAGCFDAASGGMPKIEGPGPSNDNTVGLPPPKRVGGEEGEPNTDWPGAGGSGGDLIPKRLGVGV